MPYAVMLSEAKHLRLLLNVRRRNRSEILLPRVRDQNDNVVAALTLQRFNALTTVIDPELLLQGYRLGVFPMAMEDDSIEWFSRSEERRVGKECRVRWWGDR